MNDLKPTDGTNISETELYTQIKKNIAHSYGWKYILPEEREDIINDTFYKAVEKLRDGTISGPWEPTKDSIGTKNYVFTIGCNFVKRQLNIQKRNKEMYKVPVDGEGKIRELDSFELSPSGNSFETTNLIEKIITEIDDDYERDIFQLRLEGYKFSEIAEKYNTTKFTITSRYWTIIHKIRSNNPEEIINEDVRPRYVAKIRDIKNRVIINTVTGDEYKTITEAAKALHMSYTTLYHQLLNKYSNKTNLILKEK